MSYYYVKIKDKFGNQNLLEKGSNTENTWLIHAPTKVTQSFTTGFPRRRNYHLGNRWKRNEGKS